MPQAAQMSCWYDIVGVPGRSDSGTTPPGLADGGVVTRSLVSVSSRFRDEQ